MLLKIDNLSGDLALEGGDLVWLTDLPSIVIQRIRSRLRWFRGEWFLDRRQGVPWFREVLKKGVSTLVVRSIIKDVILSTPGVRSVDRINITLNSYREMFIDFSATIDDGTTLSSQSFGPFLVRV